MKKKEIKFLIPIVVTIIILIIIRLSQPEEIDWSYDFTKTRRIPYGGYIVHDILPDLYPDADIINRDVPIYNVLKDEHYYKTNYIFINSYFVPDGLDTQYLMYYVSQGNNVFISAFDIRGKLADSLQIQTYGYFFNEDTVNINLTNSSISTVNGFTYKKGNFSNYFFTYDTARTQVLGINQDGQANFIRIRYGDGNFLLNTVPLAFSNYHLLNEDNSGYVFRALSCLPVQETIWDDYYKAGNKFTSTPLRFIVSQDSLSWAYYLGLISIILFIIFYGRRKQRIIPVIPPLRNSSLEFVRTVGNLYYQQKEHKNIATKKIAYFLDYLRNRYFLKSGVLDDEALKKISDKSLYPVEKLKNIFSLIEQIKSSNYVTETELVKVNSQIENFYERTK
jgi:hypothetical protein